MSPRTFPLSFGQRALWFVQQLAPTSSAYNLTFSVRVTGAPPAPVWRRVVQALADRHHALRTTYGMVDGEPRQTVHSELAIDFEEIDATGWDEAAVDARLGEEAGRPFDLAAGPVVRLRLLRQGAREGTPRAVFLLVLHHIAVDVPSVALLLDELLERLAVESGSIAEDGLDIAASTPLAGFPKVDESGFPPPEAHPGDFALAEAEGLSGAGGEALWRSWRERLRDLPATELPPDGPRPAERRFRGGVHERRIDPALRDAVNDLAESLGVAHPAPWLATFFLLLARRTGDRDLVVGWPALGRQDPRFAEMVGYCINPVLVRSRLGEPATLADWVRRVADDLTAAESGQGFPFPLLVERLAPERDPSRSPLYQILFSHFSDRDPRFRRLFGAPEGRLEAGGMVFEGLSVPHGGAMLDLSLSLIDGGGVLSLTLEYDADLYRPATIETLVDDYTALLAELVAEPERALEADPTTAKRAAGAPSQVVLAGPPPDPWASIPSIRVGSLDDGDDESDDGDELEGVAVVGLAGRFPGAGDADTLWRHLRAGEATIRRLDDEALRRAGIQASEIEHPDYVKASGVLDDVDLFDAPLFGINAREAALLDPQQRFFLEVAWEALEDAAVDPSRFDGEIGVYGGSSANTYFLDHYLKTGGAVGAYHQLIGSDKDFLTTRVSYKLGLRGPSINVQTACSTSLVAVHLACQSLLDGESDLALAGGVSIAVPQLRGHFYSPDGILSPDGHCRSFDAEGRGTVPGSGVGVVVLRRLSDALRDGDRVRAVLLGSAVNNDGDGKPGFTAPSVGGQARVIADALALAGIEPDTVGYVEGHGSATPLGDSIEIEALGRVFDGVAPGSCGLGSIKSNIGHLDAAAGVAGLIKTVLAVEHGEVPPSPNFAQPNPRLDLEDGPFFVDRQARPWPEEGPRRAGVSSFGLGGTNAHVVLEEAPPTPDKPSLDARPWQLLVLSAATEGSVERARGRLVDHLANDAGQAVDAVAHTLQSGRRALEHRRARVVPSAADGAREAFLEAVGGSWIEGARRVADRPVAALLPGLGEHYPGMARGLWEGEPGFRQRFDHCAERLRPRLGVDLRELLFDSDEPAAAEQDGGLDLRAMLGRRKTAETPLDRTALAQPALFAVELALAGLWSDWGIRPRALLGYSLGEYTAACLAGVLGVDDALDLVALRAQRLEELDEGAMVAIPLAETEVRRRLAERPGLAVSAVNGAELVVVSGDPGAVDGWIAELSAEGVAAQRLRSRHAFHSPAMEPAADDLRRLLAERDLQPPRVPYLSNVHGGWIRPEEATDPDYWVRHMLEPVRLHDALGALWQVPGCVLLEMGPGLALSSQALLHPTSSPLPGRPDTLALGSLPSRYERRDEVAGMLETLGRLWTVGVEVDWRGVHGGHRPAKVGLPTYAFERRRYWFEEPVGAEAPPALRAETNPPYPPFSEGGDPNLDLPASPFGKGGSRGISSGPGTLTTTVHPRPDLGHPYVAPRGAAEERMATLWCDLLGIDRVGRDDSFFELGGHSLLATQMIARLRDAGGAVPTLETLFAAPTLAAVAGSLESAGADGGAEELESIPRRSGAPDEPVPLSFAQRRLWFLDQIEPGLMAFNNPTVLRLEGPFDRRALASALATLVARHEALRTRFVAHDGEPFQVVDPVSGLGALDPTVEIDLSALPTGRRNALALELVTESVGRSFDLTQSDLLRILLVRQDDGQSGAGGEHLLAITLHHIISDEWSNGVLLEELVQLYQAAVEGRRLELPELPVQLADAALWERQRLDGEGVEEPLSFWRQHLAGAPEVSELTPDRPRPLRQSFVGSFVPFVLDEDLAPRLEALARSRGATLFMVLMASFHALLHRHRSGGRRSGEGGDDQVVGYSHGARSRLELEPLIGCFANLLPLRARPRSEGSFSDLLSEIQGDLTASFAHRETPFDLLVKHLAPERDLARHPLFQNLLVLLNVPPRSVEVGGLTFEGLAIERPGAQADLGLFVSHGEERLEGFLEYATDLFDRSTIRRLLDGWQRLLHQAVDDPGVRLAEIDLLGRAGRHQLLVEWNEGAPVQRAPLAKALRGPLAGGLASAVLGWAEQTPEAPAVVGAEAILDFATLDRRSARLASALVAAGVGPEVPVPLLTERQPALVVAILAVTRSGGYAVPLDPAGPAERLAGILANLDAPVVLATEGDGAAMAQSVVAVAGVDSLRWVLDATGEVVAGTTADLSESEVAPSVLATDPDRLAYAIYTSGSTGRPKGVEVAERAVLELLAATSDLYGLGPGDVWPLFHAYTFDVSVFEIWGSLTHGSTLVMVPRDVTRDPERFLDLLVSQGMTVLSQTPSAFQPLLASGGLARGATLRHVIFAGENLEAATLAPWFEADPSAVLTNMYGITETTVHSTARRITATDATRRSVGTPIGHALDHLEIHLLGPTLEAVPVGAVGEIFVAGGGVARGYFGAPALTAGRFVPNPWGRQPGARLYRSGDLARRRSNGELEYLGRRDAQVKIRGFRIELGEIEAALAGLDTVRQSVVVVREDTPGDRRLVAYVVAGDGGVGVDGVDVGKIRQALQAGLPEYMIPARFVALDALPLNTNGKVDRRALPAPEDDRSDLGHFVPPEGPAEERLAAVWSRVLGVPRVGAEDNFFELGGDSILAIQVVTRARRAGLDLEPRHLFQHRTVRALAAVAGSARRVWADQEPLVGPVTAMPIQHWWRTHRLEKPGHWNQGLLFEADPLLDPVHLAAAVADVERHHDALRLRLREGEPWLEVVAPADGSGSPPVSHLDLSALGDRALTELTRCAGWLQASLDLDRGPVHRLAFCDVGGGQRPRLLWVIHHLAVDGVSWRVLIEDLLTRWRPPTERDPLPPKTSAPSVFAERLAEYLRRGGFDDELDHWRGVASATTASLPEDGTGRPDVEGMARAVEVSIDPETTRTLLRRTTGGELTVDDVVVTALVHAWGRVTGEPALRLDLEAHGRDVGEGEALFDDVDLSRTVGWLTSLYPVVVRLEATAGDSLSAGPSVEDLHATHRQLRATPRRGVGWGALRWLGEGVEGLEPAPAQVVFNYLGDLDQVLSSEMPLKPAAEALGAFHDPQGERPYPLEVEASLFGGRLRISLVHAPGRHCRATVEGLATALEDALRDLATLDVSDPSRSLDGLAGVGDLDEDSLTDSVADGVEDDELSTILSQLEDAQSIEEPWT